MKRLRHPIRAIREPFGTAGLIVAMVALVAALGGSALAANGALSGKQKKEVEKIAKKFSGKPGANGATGAAGPAGKDGSNGSNGSSGGPGAAGESVTIGAASSAECASGGTKFSNKSGSGKACNGTTGFTEFLPSEKTETGSWFAQTKGEEEFEPQEFRPLARGAISFAIPLEATIPANHTILLAEGQSNVAHCPGSSASPEADPGYLCVYTGFSEQEIIPFAEAPITDPSTSPGTTGTSTTGALVQFVPQTAAAPKLAYGTWAVTAP